MHLFRNIVRIEHVQMRLSVNCVGEHAELQCASLNSV